MISAPVLVHLDYEKPFIFYTDAFYEGLEFILAQENLDRKEYPVQYSKRN